MTDVIMERAAVDPKAYVNRPVSTEGLEPLPLGTVIRAPGGQPLLAYVRLWETGDPELEALRARLLKVKIALNNRPNGLIVRSLPFGARGRSLPRRDYCTGALLNREHPEVLAALNTVARKLEARYAELAPLTFAHHVAQAGRVLPEWRLPGTACFTGGVVNRDNAIGYHNDSGNFKGTFSAMPVLRSHMAGGELVVPELGHYLPTEDGTCVFFDGQSLLHGVTPITKQRRSAHRLSVVYYSEVKLWQCLPPHDEVIRAQERRTGREIRRAEGTPAWTK